MSEDLSGLRILIVDDTAINIDVLNETLSEYKRSIATNGVKAIAVAESPNPPDLILLDIMMPEMDGYEVCKHLKSNPQTKDIPIIFSTAMDEVQDRKRGYELGAVDYITKPFETLEVKTRVKTHLSLIMARRELATLKSNS